MPVVILGAGRSGTSMLARMLNICGLNMGQTANLSASDERNPTGFWEHVGLYDINLRLLEHLGGSYEAPPQLEDGWQDAPALDGFYDEARRLIDREFQNARIWGWKLPPTTLTIPFWRKVVPDLRFIICIRNPLDVASSSTAAFGFNNVHSRRLWLYHTMTALMNTQADERIICGYESFFPDYTAGLFPVLDFLGMERPAQGSEHDRAVREFHRSDLKHHNSTIIELLTNPDVIYPVKELYFELVTGDPQATDLAIMTMSELFMPLLRASIVSEAQQYIHAKGDYLAQLGAKVAPEQQIAWIEEKWRTAELERRQFEQILSSRTHRIASAMCSIGIKLTETLVHARNCVSPNSLPSTQKTHN